MTRKITQSKNECIASVLSGRMKLLIVAAALITSGLQAQITKDTISFGEVGQINGAGTWICPAQVSSMTIECWGGGGAGGTVLSLPNDETSFANYRANVAGGGGAAGSYAAITIANPIAGNYNYVVGTGANAVSVGTTPDYFINRAVSNGTNTTFNNSADELIVKAIGGAGGESTKSKVATGEWGLGGVKATTGNIGTTSFYGGAGGNATGTTPSASTISGGGGGSAGATSDGGDATSNTAGIAGTGGGGAGLNGFSAAAGNTGGGTAATPGAGGNGAIVRGQLSTALVSRSGGKGGNGQIIITYTGGAATGLSATKANAFVTVVGKNLIMNGEVNAVEVFNAQGKLLQSQGKVTSVNNFNTGIYIVKMHTSQGVTIQKVSIR